MHSVALDTDKVEVEKPLLEEDELKTSAGVKVQVERRNHSSSKDFRNSKSNSFICCFNMVAHLIAISLPVIIAIPALMNFSFFSWHPVCMAIAVSKKYVTRKVPWIIRALQKF